MRKRAARWKCKSSEPTRKDRRKLIRKSRNLARLIASN
jgi:hypothetical protein